MSSNYKQTLINEMVELLALTMVDEQVNELKDLESTFVTNFLIQKSFSPLGMQDPKTQRKLYLGNSYIHDLNPTEQKNVLLDAFENKSLIYAILRSPQVPDLGKPVPSAEKVQSEKLAQQQSPLNQDVVMGKLLDMLGFPEYPNLGENNNNEFPDGPSNT